MATIDLHITRPDQLWGIVRHDRTIRRIKLDLPELPHDQQALTEHRLAQLARPCGCTEGAIAMLIALPVAYAVFRWGWPPDTTFGLRFSSAMALAVAACLIGKGIGIYRGRRALQRYVQRIFAETQNA